MASPARSCTGRGLRTTRSPERCRGASWHELPEGAINVGGKPVELPTYRVFLTVPQGTPGIHGPLNEQRRNKLVREVTELVLAAEGATDIEAHGSRCLVHDQRAVRRILGRERAHLSHD